MTRADRAPYSRDRVAEPEQETVDHETVVDEASAPAARVKPWRIALLIVLLLGLLALAKLAGLEEYFDVDRVRALMDSAGAWGFLAFVVLFAVGELLHVPGFVFVGAASLAYGQGAGTLAAYAGAMGSVTISFLVVRTIGGQPLGGVRRPWMRKMLARLETRPILTVAVLRAIFWLSPALNYGLAMTSVKMRDYLIGSALGLAIPIPVVVFFFDWIAARFL